MATATVLSVDTAEGPGSFKLVKSPAGWTDPANPGEKIDQATITDLLDAFAGLKAERFVETDAKEGTKIFGLDPPRKTVTVNTQGQSRTLLLGRVDDEKRAYAQVGGEKAKKEVFVLTAGDTAKINRDRAGFLAPATKKEESKKEDAKKEDPKKADPKPTEPKK